MKDIVVGKMAEAKDDSSPGMPLITEDSDNSTWDVHEMAEDGENVAQCPSRLNEDRWRFSQTLPPTDGDRDSAKALVNVIKDGEDPAQILEDLFISQMRSCGTCMDVDIVQRRVRTAGKLLDMYLYATLQPALGDEKVKTLLPQDVDMKTLPLGSVDMLEEYLEMSVPHKTAAKVITHQDTGEREMADRDYEAWRSEQGDLLDEFRTFETRPFNSSKYKIYSDLVQFLHTDETTKDMTEQEDVMLQMHGPQGMERQYGTEFTSPKDEAGYRNGSGQHLTVVNMYDANRCNQNEAVSNGVHVDQDDQCSQSEAGYDGTHVDRDDQCSQSEAGSDGTHVDRDDQYSQSEAGSDGMHVDQDDQCSQSEARFDDMHVDSIASHDTSGQYVDIHNEHLLLCDENGNHNQDYGDNDCAMSNDDLSEDGDNVNNDESQILSPGKNGNIACDENENNNNINEDRAEYVDENCDVSDEDYDRQNNGVENYRSDAQAKDGYLIASDSHTNVGENNVNNHGIMVNESDDENIVDKYYENNMEGEVDEKGYCVIYDDDDSFDFDDDGTPLEDIFYLVPVPSGGQTIGPGLLDSMYYRKSPLVHDGGDGQEEVGSHSGSWSTRQNSTLFDGKVNFIELYKYLNSQ